MDQTPPPTPQEDDQEWLPLVDEGDFVLPAAQVSLHAVVLASRAIPYIVEPVEEGWQLKVPAPHLDAALLELRRYREENREWPPLPAVSALPVNPLATLSILFLLATFHNLTLLDLPGIPDLYLSGRMDAGRVLAGEWWRAATALMLHSDVAHLAGNLAIGGIIMLLLGWEVGTPLAWFLTLTAGVAGNLVNALVQPSQHVSVGASTAVFGAISILGVVGMLRHRRQRRLRFLLPLAAAVTLLVVLGTEGERTDLGAHLFGFAAGIPMGWLAHVTRKLRHHRFVQIAAGLAACAVVAGSWCLAVCGAG